jgi:HEPN domain-containing protein
MASSKRVQALLQMAEEDLAGARAMLDTSTRLARYHLQQSAEKAIKALLEHRGLNPGREHRFGSLAEMIPGDDEWRARIQGFDVLSSAATTHRYPTAEGRILPAPTRQLVESEIASVDELVRDVRQAVTRPASSGFDDQPLLSPVPDRASALAAKIVATATARNLALPDNIVETLTLFVDEPTLRQMVRAVTTASSFQDALNASAVIIPERGGV